MHRENLPLPPDAEFKLPETEQPPAGFDVADAAAEKAVALEMEHQTRDAMLAEEEASLQSEGFLSRLGGKSAKSSKLAKFAKTAVFLFMAGSKVGCAAAEGTPQVDLVKAPPAATAVDSVDEGDRHDPGPEGEGGAEAEKTSSWDVADEGVFDDKGEIADNEKFGQLVEEVAKKVNADVTSESLSADQEGLSEFIDTLDKVHQSVKSEDGSKMNKTSLFAEGTKKMFLSETFQKFLGDFIQSNEKLPQIQQADMTYMNALSLAEGASNFLEAEFADREGGEPQEPTAAEVEKAIKFVWEQTQNKMNTELFGPNTEVINLVHPDFDGGEVDKITEKTGAKKVTTFKGDTKLQSENLKAEALKAISESEGSTTIVINAHGDRYSESILGQDMDGDGVISDEVRYVVSLHGGTDVTIDANELADAMSKSGNAKNINLVGANCDGHAFVNQVYDQLSASGSEVPSLAVAAAGEGKSAWVANGDQSGFLLSVLEKTHQGDAVLAGDIADEAGTLAARQKTTFRVGVDASQAADSGYFGHRSVTM